MYLSNLILSYQIFSFISYSLLLHYIDANLFKEHFDRAKRINAGEIDVPEITTQLAEDIRKEAKEKASEAQEAQAQETAAAAN